MKVTVLLLGIATLLSACTSVSTDRDPRVDFGGFKSFFVIHRLTDNHHLDETIVDALKSRGFEASAGPLTMMPQNTDAVLTYRDDWAWDFKTYLLQLDLEIRRAHTNQLIAYGTYRQPSIITKHPAAVVDVLLTRILEKHKPD